MDNKYTYGTLCKCLRCGGEWRCRQGGKPVNCAKCNSSYWDKPKVRKPKNGEDAITALEKHLQKTVTPEEYSGHTKPAPKPNSK